MKRAMVVAAFMGGALTMTAEAGSLSGTVVDRSTSLPLPGALVTVHVLLPDSIAYPDTTDETGAYRIDDIVGGNQIYVVMAGKPAYRGYYFRYDEIGTGSYRLDIVLEPEDVEPPGGSGDSAEVSGQVLGREGSSQELAALVGAEVRLSDSTQTHLAVSDGQGQYRAVVPQGTYTITVSAQGFHHAASTGMAVGVGGLTYGAVLTRTVTHAEENPESPGHYALIGAYPNPFNPTTRIRYTIPAQGSGGERVTIAVYDLLGREVAVLLDQGRGPGTYEAEFDGTQLSSGIYVCRLRAGSFEASSKVVLAR